MLRGFSMLRQVLYFFAALGCLLVSCCRPSAAAAAGPATAQAARPAGELAPPVVGGHPDPNAIVYDAARLAAIRRAADPPHVPGAVWACPQVVPVVEVQTAAGVVRV